MGWILGPSLVGARVDAALRARVVHPELAVLVDDVGSEDVLVVEGPLLAEGESGRVAVPLPVLRFEPGIKGGNFFGRRRGVRADSQEQEAADGGCQPDAGRVSAEC